MIWLTLRLVLILSDGIIIIIFLVVQELKHDLTPPYCNLSEAMAILTLCDKQLLVLVFIK